MAIKTTCDGTGVEIPSDTQTTGFFGHQYSDAARPAADAYLSEIDAIHTKHATEFAAELKALRDKYHSILSQLPDES